MKKTNEHYVNNAHFFEALVAYKKDVATAKKQGTEIPQVPEYIGECIIQIANNFATKSNFVNYTYKDDMILDAIENCLTYLGNFDPAKSTNPFAYFSQISYYAFLRRIAKEKKHQDIASNLLINMDIDGLSLQEGDQADHNFVLSTIQMINESYVKDGDIVRPKILKRPKYLDEVDPDDDHEEPTEINDGE